MDEDIDFSGINEKHQQVQIWLQQIYGGESVPKFELNARTISILYTLMKENTDQEHNTQLVIEDLRQKATEYGAEAQRLSAILTEIHLTQGCLSQSGTTSLQTLASLALHLEIKDTSDSSYLLALQRHSDEAAKTSEQKNGEERALSQFTHKSKSALHKYNSLLKTLHTLEEKSVTQQPNTENKRKKVNFLLDKTKQYKASLQQLKRRLAQAGADPSLYHQTLIKKAEHLESLRQKMSPLRTKLQSYHDLPPDISQTKVKIEELKQQVGALETELSRRIDLMHL